jgi:hypothetical protein
MDQDLFPGNQVLEQRIELLRALADSLRSAQAAVLNKDPRQMNSETRRQWELCSELRRLKDCRRVGGDNRRDSELPSSTTSAGSRRQTLQAELAAAEKQVADLNRLYGALLRRARRTAEIFCRILGNSGVTYLPPAPRAVSRTPEPRR